MNSVKVDVIEVLEESSDWLAVMKPAGVATIPGRDGEASVLELLAAQLGLTAGDGLRVVHRLDKDTSGVLLFAKGTAAQRRLCEQFRKQTVRKEYLALVAGRPETKEGEIEATLARHPTSPKRMAVVRHGGRPARTAWRVEEKFSGFTLLRVFPKTGKTHQIRVHLKHVGLPLAIDPLYHSKEPIFLSQLTRDYRPNRDQKEWPLIGRLTLHAEKLTFEDSDGQTRQIVATPPKDFRATITQLRRIAGRPTTVRR